MVSHPDIADNDNELLQVKEYSVRIVVKRSRQGLLGCTDHFSTAKVHAL